MEVVDRTAVDLSLGEGATQAEHLSVAANIPFGVQAANGVDQLTGGAVVVGRP